MPGERGLETALRSREGLERSTVTEIVELDTALQKMAEAQVRRLPVVEDGRLVGILAQADVARTASQGDTGAMVEEISQEA